LNQSQHQVSIEITLICVESISTSSFNRNYVDLLWVHFTMIVHMQNHLKRMEPIDSLR